MSTHESSSSSSDRKRPLQKQTSVDSGNEASSEESNDSIRSSISFSNSNKRKDKSSAADTQGIAGIRRHPIIVSALVHVSSFFRYELGRLVAGGRRLKHQKQLLHRLAEEGKTRAAEGEKPLYGN